MLQEYIDNWGAGKTIFTTIIGGFATWIGWRVVNTKKSIKAAEDNAFADIIGKMVPVIDQIQAPYKDDLKRVNDKLDSLTADHIQLQIEVGVLKKMAEEKDKIIALKEAKIKRLEERIQELESA